MEYLSIKLPLKNGGFQEDAFRGSVQKEEYREPQR